MVKLLQHHRSSPELLGCSAKHVVFGFLGGSVRKREITRAGQKPRRVLEWCFVDRRRDAQACSRHGCTRAEVNGRGEGEVTLKVKAKTRNVLLQEKFMRFFSYPLSVSVFLVLRFGGDGVGVHKTRVAVRVPPTPRKSRLSPSDDTVESTRHRRHPPRACWRARCLGTSTATNRSKHPTTAGLAKQRKVRVRGCYDEDVKPALLALLQLALRMRGVAQPRH
jgi:hypothetical protein